eukprot:TRINITY_DN57931_c0_g1_i1.p1 TRINITY_DN57931_c0_g1~~TRINITY_DN57931_c0_g1_i1.p1  ORF type:complete len:463 (-),score=136.18 TRINITY_DN57931_c0_g1_i1:21-1409(-)
MAAVQELDLLRSSWETERQDLERSQRVQDQLRVVLLSLQQKCDELCAENKRVRAETDKSNPLCPAIAALDRELEALGHCMERLRSQQTGLATDVSEQLRAEGASKAREAHCQSKLVETLQIAEDFQEKRQAAEMRDLGMQEQARNLVSRETLEVAGREVEQLQDTLLSQQAEAARLRQALADAWAARKPEELDFGGGEAVSAESPTTIPEGTREELEWLATMRQETASEACRLQSLEQSEGQLREQLKVLAEDKASLQSARVDFEDLGNALREAIASQSEGYVRKVGGLAEARRSADEDRMKLIQECADMQAQLDAIGPELEGLSEVETQHAKLEAAHTRLFDENQRLRDVNGALGAQLLGHEGPGQDGAISGAVSRALQLQRKLVQRQDAQDNERQQLAERIRSLERSAAGLPDDKPQSAGRRCQSSSAPAATAGGGALSTASSMLKGGLGRLKEATLNKI